MNDGSDFKFTSYYKSMKLSHSYFYSIVRSNYAPNFQLLSERIEMKDSLKLRVLLLVWIYRAWKKIEVYKLSN